MKTASFLLLAAGLGGSCGSSERRPHYVESYRLTITPHAHLVVTPRHSTEGALPLTYYTYHRAPGSKQVVEISYAHGDSTYTDATTSEALVFELADTATAFRLYGRAFDQHSALYERRCLCVDPGANKPRRVPDLGNSISGQQLTPTRWRIQCAVGTIDFTDIYRYAAGGSASLNLAAGSDTKIKF